MAMQEPPESPTERVRGMLGDVAAAARREITRIEDAPQARALLEVTAEVLAGLETAYRHYRERSEAARQGSD